MPRIRTVDAVPPQPDQVTEVRRLVVMLGGRLIEEREARRNQTREIERLRAEVLQVRAQIRTLGRR
jgi:hypothetical protein